MSDFARARAEEEAHSVKALVMWRNISYFVAVPALLFLGVNSYLKEMAHFKHLEEHGREEYRQFTHLALRTKPFPWGDGNHTLLHNPHTNALPDGYEDED